MLNLAYSLMSFQLVDSELPGTRRYWRGEVWKLPDAIATDPRPMKEIFGRWPNWRNPNLDDMPDLSKPLEE